MVRAPATAPRPASAGGAHQAGDADHLGRPQLLMINWERPALPVIDWSDVGP
jgi:hypothetical protein